MMLGGAAPANAWRWRPEYTEYFNVKTSHWEVEGGAAYKVMAEASRTDIRFSSPIAIKEADTTYDLSVLPYHVAE